MHYAVKWMMERPIMGKEDRPKGKLTLGWYVTGVVAVLFFLFWFFVMLDGFGWVID